MTEVVCVQGGGEQCQSYMYNIALLSFVDRVGEPAPSSFVYGVGEPRRRFVQSGWVSYRRRRLCTGWVS